MDRAIVNCAAILDEAWAWSFDVDVWRAHLNAQTWPEVGLTAGGQFCLLPVSKPQPCSVGRLCGRAEGVLGSKGLQCACKRQSRWQLTPCA